MKLEPAVFANFTANFLARIPANPRAWPRKVKFRSMTRGASIEAVNRTLSRRAWLGVAGAATVATLAGCGSTKTKSGPTVTVTVPRSAVIPDENELPVITDPQVALDTLMAGNQRFVKDKLQEPGRDPARRLKLAQGQHPFATILACSDSRLPPELIFDQGFGDLFVVRVAGNIVDDSLVGSIEYAVDHLHTPLIMVIGHEKCGAVEATLESIQQHQPANGEIEVLVNAITPAVAAAEQRSGDLLDNTVRANAQQSLDTINKSSELTGPLSSGQFKAIAAYYSIDDGRVSLI